MSINKLRALFFLVCSCCILVKFSFAADSAWGEIKDKHFVIYYEVAKDKSLAASYLRQAEKYYQIIGERIGYSRANKMWTWDERVQIFLFATQESFSASTGQPAWSTGYADRDSRFFKSKTIVTFSQEKDFGDSTLPHEISHLILHDFISNSDRIPIWFDEGVAQMQEKDKLAMVKGIMKTLVRRSQHIPFDQFLTWDIRKERDTRKVQIFYAQSLSVVEYLITKFGVDAFGRLCRQLRDGKDFTQSLLATYSGVFSDVYDLERKWVLSFR